MREKGSLQRLGYWAGLAAIMLIAIALRCGGVVRESAWFDEVLSLQTLDASSLSAFWTRLSEADPPAILAPGYFTVEYGWASVFGHSVISLRCFSLIFGILSIPLLALLGRRFAGGSAGLIAALCLACSLPHIYYSQEIRMYALVLFLTLLSVETLLRAMEGKEQYWWLIHGFSNALLIWSSIFTLGMVLVEGLCLLWADREKWQRSVKWGIFHVALLGLFAVWFATHYVNSAFWMPAPTWREGVNTYVVFAGGRFSNENPSPYLPGNFSLDGMLIVFYFFCVIFTLLRRGQLSRCLMYLLLGWLIIPPLVLFTLAVVWKPCFLYRYVLYASFPLYLFAGSAFVALSSKWIRSAFVVAIVLLYGYQNLVCMQGPFRPDYRTVSDFIVHMDDLRNASSTVPVLILKDPLNRLPMQYLNSIPGDRLFSAHGAGDLESQTLALLRSHGQIYVLFWRWDRLDAYQTFLERRRIIVRKWSFGGMPPLSLYMLSEATDDIIVKNEDKKGIH